MYDYSIFEADIATLEDVIAIVYEEFPEARGLFQVLLGQDECKKLLAESETRKNAREL